MSPVNSPDFKCTRLMVTCHAVAVYRGGLFRRLPTMAEVVVLHHFQAKKSKPILQATAEGDTVSLFLANEHCTVPEGIFGTEVAISFLPICTVPRKRAYYLTVPYISKPTIKTLENFCTFGERP